MIELACDESGAEGEKLVGATTDVFAHASVRLAAADAVGAVRGLRQRGPTPAVEYKAGHALREKNRAALRWFLSSSGPLGGAAHVHVVDKAYLVVRRLVGLLVPGADGDALYRTGRNVADRATWLGFLAAANALMRAAVRRGEPPSVDVFFAAVGMLRRSAPPGPGSAVLAGLAGSGTRVAVVREHLRHNPTVLPPLDPLVPAIVRAVVRSGEGPTLVVHDRHIALTEARIAEIARLSGGRLAGLRLGDSRVDPRIQVADVLAGVAARIASDALAGRADPGLAALLQPYVDPMSVWGDERSRRLLVPARQRA